MALLAPLLPPYSAREWLAKPFSEKLKLACQAWATQGYGTPWPIYLVYLIKIGLYVGAWVFFCSLSTGLGGAGAIGSWWAAPEALQKAVLWSMLFEVLGLGCGSGPLTGRYAPPIGGALYFARPGTTKMPLFPGAPLIGGDRRTPLDVGLYLAHIGFLVRALISPSLGPDLIAPTLILLPIIGLGDKTVFLASRAEHYGAALVCFAFPGEGLAGAKVVWAAVWLWAATSKLNRHFPSVIAVMQSNSPLTAFGSVRKLLFRRYPDDLRPSRLAAVMAHTGTVIEYAFPIALLAGTGGAVTRAALITMLLFHLFITSSIPMGVPLEWNVMMVYGAFVLFGHHASVSVLSISSPILIAFLAGACFLVQLTGNLVPSRVSFLCAMRYYAGNWAYSVWLFKGDSQKKLSRLRKSAPLVTDQLRTMYDEETITLLLSKLVAFRAMHLQGRALQILLPKAVDDLEAYEYQDGEIVAGIVLGYNFGDGHLHDLQLLRAVQRQCHFEEGELRCVMVESQPMGGSSLSWTIADAATGVRETGQLRVTDLEALQPWPEKSSPISAPTPAGS